MEFFAGKWIESISIPISLPKGILPFSGQWEFSPLAFYLIFAHFMGVQGLFHLLTGQVPWQHLIFIFCVGYIGSVGVFAGGHRLWSHRSYKARAPLRILLALMHSLAGMGSVIRWARDHRLHHKYSETEGDPHNIGRGLFFAHIGWIMLKKPKSVTDKFETIDYSDLYRDWVVAYQDKFFVLFELVMVHTLPVFIPNNIWGTPLYISMCTNYFRFVLFYHIASLGNSVAHSWIRKPYEKSIGPSDVTWLSLLLVGEGWHNFHHVFPYDYRSTDVGFYGANLATMFIDFMERIGLAYDLKAVPDHVIQKRAGRTGDGSVHPNKSHENIQKNMESDGAISKETKNEGQPYQSSLIS